MASTTSTMRRDILSAYAAAGSRIASWALVSAMVYRSSGADSFAVLAFVRGTIGVLNYAALGIGPAMVRLLSEARAQPDEAPPPTPVSNSDSRVLSYHAPSVPPADPVRTVYVTGLAYTVVTILVGIALLAVYFVLVQHTRLSRIYIPGDASLLIFWMSAGMLVRLLGEGPSAILQTSGHIALDNIFIAFAELLWPLLVYVSGQSAVHAGFLFLVSSVILQGLRVVVLDRRAYPWSSSRHYFSGDVFRRLFSLGALITVGQLADYLYAPTDYILINWLLAPMQIAVYAPAIHVDAAMLVLVSGLASVLLPKTAAADTTGDTHTIRRYYINGTLFSLALLASCALAICFVSPLLFRLWLGDSLPSTQAILPLILIHTVIGGSSAVGRSVLLGMGKVKPFTLAVLIAGLGNVILSYCFVKYLHLGLRGIILGTIIVVVARCAIWMPWYVMRTLRNQNASVQASATEPIAITPTV